MPNNASSLFNGVKAALDEGLAQLKGVPVLTVSGKTGKGIDQILGARSSCAKLVAARSDRRAQPLVRKGGRDQPAAGAKGKRIKLRYITQVKNRPPSFVVFGNRIDELPDSYRRYLVNAIRRDLEAGPGAAAPDLPRLAKTRSTR